MASKQRIVSLKIKSLSELKSLLQDLKFKIDGDGYILDERNIPILDSNKDFIHFSEVNSILPGSKIIIKNGDYSKVSEYYENYLNA